MEPRQTETIEKTVAGVDNENASLELLKIQQEQWISYCALWGLITYEPEEINPETGLPNIQQIKAMTIIEFAKQIGVGRATLYRWKQSIPDFASRVRERRKELFSLSRESVLYNRAYLIALTSKDHKAAGDMIKMLTGNFAGLELPVQRQVIKHGGDIRLSWADLVVKKKQELVEAEIVNDPNLNSK